MANGAMYNMLVERHPLTRLLDMYGSKVNMGSSTPHYTPDTRRIDHGTNPPYKLRRYSLCLAGITSTTTEAEKGQDPVMAHDNYPLDLENKK